MAEYCQTEAMVCNRTANRGVIAAGHPDTAAAGVEMLRLGGNAFDAAVAAVFAAFVVESTLTSAGGGGFLLAHTPEQGEILFDFFTQTPRQRKPQGEIDFYPVGVDFGDTVQEFHIGLGSVAVPGNVAGLLHVHQRLGQLPLSVIIEPAVHYARSGVVLNTYQTYCHQILRPIILASPASRQIYAPQGELLQPGEVFRMPALGDALELLAKRGATEFYQGAIGHQIIRDCQQQGGLLTLEDLQAYRVLERQPLRLPYRDYTLLTNPLPSAGGTLIAFALQLLAARDLQQIGFGTPEYVQLLAQVMALTNEARRQGYDAQIYQPEFAQRFLANPFLQPYRDRLLQPVNKWGSTTHVSVIDGAGNAATVTTSNGEGSGYIIPGTGIMLNNMLGEEDLNPHGFHQWQEDVRISSMMAPTLVLQGHRPKVALGSGGSNRIRTAILQVICNILDFGMTVEEAVTAPRIHWENHLLNLEPGFAAVLPHLTLPAGDRTLLWQQAGMFFGGVHTVMQTDGGELVGAGDPRRLGAIGVWENVPS